MYPDGHPVYAINYVEVPRGVIDGSIRLEQIESERNAEVRRVMIDRYPGGLRRYLEDIGAEEVHRDECGVLLQRYVPYDRVRSMTAVRVVNSTPEPDGSRREYVLQVPHRCKTAREAVAWTFGLEPEEYRPAVET